MTMAGARQRIDDLAARVLVGARRLYAPYLERIRPYISPYVARLRARYERLEPREKLLVQVAGVLLAGFFAYNFVYLPIQDMRQDLRERTEARQKEILEVRRLAQEYRQLKLEVSAAEKRTVKQSKDFSLFSAVEGMLTKTVGVAKVGSINPGEDRKISTDLVQHNLEITLSGVSLDELVSTLYGVQTLPVPVLVSDLHIKKGAVGGTFDVDMTCVAIGRS